MEEYKYITWTKEGKYFSDHYLMEVSRCRQFIHQTLSLKASDVFVSIQNYTGDGRCIGCPLYFDIDSESLYDAYETMRELVDAVEEVYDVEPKVFFSGSKGFHVIAPIYIKHERCHEIMRLIIEDHFSHLDLDPRVYRSKGMFRVTNTINTKTNKYKINVNSFDNLETILKLADRPSNTKVDWGKMIYIDTDQYEERLHEYAETYRTGEQKDFIESLPPCGKSIWLLPSPQEGTRHSFLHYLARHAYNCLYTQQEAEDIIGSHHFYGSEEGRSVSNYRSVINSVYRYGRSGIGCERGNDALLLRPYCQKLCMFNKELSIFDLLRGGDEYI